MSIVPKDWGEDEELLVCALWPEGIKATCEVCGANVCCFPATRERAAKKASAHIVCAPCFRLIYEERPDAVFGGVIRDNKIMDADAGEKGKENWGPMY